MARDPRAAAHVEVGMELVYLGADRVPLLCNAVEPELMVSGQGRTILDVKQKHGERISLTWGFPKLRGAFFGSLVEGNPTIWGALS